MPGPDGIRMDDGFSTLISFSLKPNIGVWEKEVQPFGVEGGDAVQTTTMRNQHLETFNPRHLSTLTRGSFKVAYANNNLSDILSMVNKYQTITVTFPDGTSWSFWGYLKSFVPDSLVMHAQPLATVEVVTTNQTPAGVEAGPTVYAEAVGAVDGVAEDYQSTNVAVVTMAGGAEHGLETDDLVYLTTPGGVGVYKVDLVWAEDPLTEFGLVNVLTDLPQPAFTATGGRVFRAALHGTFIYGPSDSGSVIPISPTLKAFTLAAIGNGGPYSSPNAGGGGAYSGRQVTGTMPADITIEIHPGSSPGPTKARWGGVDRVNAPGATGATGAVAGDDGQINYDGGDQAGGDPGQAGNAGGAGVTGGGTGQPGDGCYSGHANGYDGQLILKTYVLS